MTEDEKLVEKVAEAMWNAAHGANYKWSDCVQNRTYELAINIQRDIARAAIVAVREHDKEKGLVHADSTGADLPSSLTAPHRHMKGGIQG